MNRFAAPAADARRRLLGARGRAHRAVGRLALEALQRRAEPAEAQDEQAEDPAGDQEQAQPDALVLGLGVLVRHPHLRHGSPARRPPPAWRGGPEEEEEEESGGWVEVEEEEEETLFVCC